MKTKTRVMRVFSLMLALTLVFATYSTQSYALTPQQFNAWIAAALSAANIYVSSIGIPIADALDNLSNPPAWADVDPQYTYSWTDDAIDEYMNRSTIKIRPDQIIIDGVTYQDVWLSHDAAEAFRVNSYDAITAWNIASESNGTFVSGAGSVYNIPFYNRDNKLMTQVYKFSKPGTYKTGNIVWTITDALHGRYNYSANVNSGQYSYSGSLLYATEGVQLRKNDVWGIVVTTDSGQTFGFNRLDNSTEISSPFDFDWVSGTIPLDEPIDPDDGIMIRIPYSGSNNPLDQFRQDNPDFVSDDGIQIDTTNIELMNKIDDLMDLIIPLIPIINVDYTKYDNIDPQPQPEPIPDPAPYPDPLPDPSIELINSTLKDIIQALKNIFDNISITNSYNIAIKNIMDVVKWNIDIATDQISSIASGINQIIQQIGDIANKIITGNADWFSDIVDAIRVPFLSWLNIFKAATGIWHYVVTWVQNISSPFSYFWNILGNVNTIFYSPIYAVAAATIVIAIYRRFGK